MAMEIYYAVQSITTATEINENFHGEVHTCIYGKGDYKLFYETPDGWNNCNLLAPYFVRQYGYKRECDARRNWCYKNPENSRYWRTETKIVRLWVRKDNTVHILL